jgi:hypothetical protein
MAPQTTCTISRICIYTDMTRPHSPIFPVGYVAELITPQSRILGIVGRERLEPGELDLLHGLLRHQASDLWESLVAEFDLAAGMERGKSLEYLAARHSYAFSVEQPKPVTVPQSLIDAADQGKESLQREFRSFLLEQARTDLTQYESGIRAKFAA